MFSHKANYIIITQRDKRRTYPAKLPKQPLPKSAIRKEHFNFTHKYKHNFLKNIKAHILFCGFLRIYLPRPHNEVFSLTCQSFLSFRQKLTVLEIKEVSLQKMAEARQLKQVSLRSHLHYLCKSKYFKYGKS